jgi:quinol monooxygenase YgiN
MWAQLQTLRLKGDRADEVFAQIDRLRSFEQPDSGLLRTLAMRDQKDPSRVFVLVLFESEERAREREQDPRREEGLKELRAALPDILEGPPEFVDLEVVVDNPAVGA